MKVQLVQVLVFSISLSISSYAEPYQLADENGAALATVFEGIEPTAQGRYVLARAMSGDSAAPKTSCLSRSAAWGTSVQAIDDPLSPLTPTATERALMGATGGQQRKFACEYECDEGCWDHYATFWQWQCGLGCWADDCYSYSGEYEEGCRDCTAGGECCACEADQLCSNPL